MTNKTDVEIGTRFSRLTTVSETYLKPRKDGRNRAWVSVKCDCGNTKEVALHNLQSGNTTSCGCLHTQAVSVGGKSKVFIRLWAEQGNELAGYERERNHGFSKTQLYRIWKGMIRRCEVPTAPNYRWYGGKGISVDNFWRADFLIFKQWAEENGYSEGLQIDRIDSDEDYCPDNCRWITKKQNIRNRDVFWSEELDEALIKYAKEHGMNPYAVIESAVAGLVLKGGDGIECL